MPRAKPWYEDRIIRDPDILVGKPVVKGTRISVEKVLFHLATTMDLEDLFAAYPRLTIDDVKACLHYAHDVVEQKGRPRKSRQHTQVSDQ